MFQLCLSIQITRERCLTDLNFFNFQASTMKGQKKAYLLHLAKELSIDIKLPLPFVLAIETFSYCQIFAIILNSSFTQNSNRWTSDLFRFFKEILSISTIFDPFNVFDSESSTMVVWFIITILLLVYMIMLAIINILIMMSIKKLWFSKTLTTLSLVHSRIFFYPFHYFYLNVIQLHLGDTSARSFLQNTGIFAFTLCLILMNSVLSLLKEFMFYRITKDKSSYSSKSNAPSKLILIYKLILIIIITFTTSKATHISAIGIFTVFYIIAANYVLYSQLPYYNLRLMKFSFTLTNLGICFIIYYYLNCYTGSQRVAEAIFFISVPFVIKFCLTRLRKQYDRILCGDFDSIEKAIHLPILLKEYVSRYDNIISARKLFPETSLYFYSFFSSSEYIIDDNAEKLKSKDLMNEKILFSVYQDLYFTISRLSKVWSLFALRRKIV